MTDVGRKNDLKTIAMGSVACALVYMSGLFVVFTPLPVFYVFTRRGARDGIATIGLSLLVVALIHMIVVPLLGGVAGGETMTLVMSGAALMSGDAQPSIGFFGIAYFIFFMTIAAALGLGLGRKWSLTRWVGTAVAAGIGGIVTMAAIAEAMMSASLMVGVKGYIQTAVEDVIRLNQAAGMASMEMRYVMEHQDEIVRFVWSILPSALFVFTLLIVVLNIFVARRIAAMPRAVASLKGTMTFRLPDALVWFVIAGGSLFFADRYLMHTGWLATVGINGLIILGSIYFLQGFAVAAYFLGRVRMRFVRILAYATIIIFFQSAGLMLVGLGLADVWIHFRERAKAAVSGGR